MILVAPHALALEQFRKPQTGHNLALMDKIVSIFRLVDDEFTDLL